LPVPKIEPQFLGSQTRTTPIILSWLYWFTSYNLTDNENVSEFRRHEDVRKWFAVKQEQQEFQNSELELAIPLFNSSTFSLFSPFRYFEQKIE
jgi:hypothetical protein